MKIPLPIFLLPLIAGCGEPNDAKLWRTEMEQRLQSQQMQINDLRSLTQSTHSNLTRMDFKFVDYKTAANLIDTKLNESHVVTIDPAKTYYQRLDMDNGFLFISCRDATPYLDGYKVKLQIGNPLLTTFHGCQIGFRWGKHFTNSDIGNFEWETWKHSTTTSITQDILPGKWNEIEVTLTPATASEIREITVAVATSRLSLK